MNAHSLNQSDLRELTYRLLFSVGLMTALVSSALAQGGRVCLYELPNYRGQSICFSPGQQVSEFNSIRGGWNDRAQSVRVFGNAEATIYEHAAFSGASFFVNSDVPNLGMIRRMRGGLANEVSSITVESKQLGRRSDYNEAFRLGQRDFLRGLRQNYRQYSSRYDRMGEAEFRRGYQEGYQAARDGRDWDPRFNRPQQPQQ
jgi:hypothetical protein